MRCAIWFAGSPLPKLTLAQLNRAVNDGQGRAGWFSERGGRLVTESIREATTENEVFALLNAYIYEALSCGKFSVLPAKIGLEVNDLADVHERCSSE